MDKCPQPGRGGTFHGQADAVLADVESLARERDQEGIHDPVPPPREEQGFVFPAEDALVSVTEAAEDLPALIEQSPCGAVEIARDLLGLVEGTHRAADLVSHLAPAARESGRLAVAGASGLDDPLCDVDSEDPPPASAENDQAARDSRPPHR